MHAPEGIYLDYAATTPLDPRVASAMSRMLMDATAFGNPASFFHAYGSSARKQVELARAEVARLFRADPEEVYFTSGATESNNLAIAGCAKAYAKKGNHLVTLRSEHDSVLRTCQHLETQGYRVSYLQPLPNGKMDLEALKRVLHSGTILVSVMHVNNETGVIQDIQAIGELARVVGAKLHVDAAQSAGKFSWDWLNQPVDLLSVSAHKMHGPKGIGALLVRREPRCRLHPVLHGGGQEKGLRPGTLATHQIHGFGVAAQLAQSDWEQDWQHAQQLRSRFLCALQEQGLQRVVVHSPPDASPYIVNFRCEWAQSKAVRDVLQGVALSAGSACHSADIVPSHVLTAMGMERGAALQALRVSWGRGVRLQDVEEAAARIAQAVQWVRSRCTASELLCEEEDANRD